MTVSVPGNSPANSWQTGSTISFTNRNEVWALLSLKAPGGSVGGTSQNIMQSHANQSGGLRWYLQNSNILGLWRTSANNTNKTFGAFTAGQDITVAIKISQTENLVTHWFNGTKNAALDLAFSAAVAGDLQPILQGVAVDGSDIEIYEAYIGFGGVPTDTQLENHSIGDDLSVTMPGLTVIKGTRAQGSGYASQLNCVTGSNHFAITAGDTTNANSNQPTFLGSADALSSPSSSATARVVTLQCSSSSTGGTIYIRGDLAANLPSAVTEDDIPDIVAGVLEDGTTDAAFAVSVDMTGTSSLDEEIVAGLADSALRFHVVHDTDDAGAYTNILTFDVTTKRPVVVPAGSDKRLFIAGAVAANVSDLLFAVRGTEFSEDYATDGTGLFEIDLTNYVSGGAAVDIGDSIGIEVFKDSGENLIAVNQTITEGA